VTKHVVSDVHQELQGAAGA